MFLFQMMAAMVTYLVVLLQFRQSDEKTDCQVGNATILNSMLDVEYSG